MNHQHTNENKTHRILVCRAYYSSPLIYDLFLSILNTIVWVQIYYLMNSTSLGAILTYKQIVARHFTHLAGTRLSRTAIKIESILMIFSGRNRLENVLIFHQQTAS